MTGSSPFGSLLGHTLVPLVLVFIILVFSMVSHHYQLKRAFIIAARVTVGEAATEAGIEMLQHFAVIFFPKLWRQDQGRLDKLRQLKNVLRDTSFTDSKTQNLLSGAAFILIILPILVVPFALHLDKAPSTHDPSRSTHPSGMLLGVAIKEYDSATGLRVASTTGAHEATSLAKSLERNKKQLPMMPAYRMVSSDVWMDPLHNRVIVPSRVKDTCQHEVVKAFNIPVLVASYSCMRWAGGNASQTDVEIDLSSITHSNGVDLGQRIRIVYTDRAVQCDTYYHILEADITWHGKGHACKIVQDRCVLHTTYNETYVRERLYTAMTDLRLPFNNAYKHLVNYRAFAINEYEDFYGVIHAAGVPLMPVVAMTPTQAGAFGARSWFMQAVGQGVGSHLLH
jgi:hypothetical protein